MNKKYEKVKVYYNGGNGLWSLRQVKDAVTKDWITVDEFTEITGEEYEEATE
ncbi:MAG: XkdX family protein [Lachnospiraceae bacterium]|nr:XkdX family protein [Lachnospiraceae bacterium]